MADTKVSAKINSKVRSWAGSKDVIEKWECGGLPFNSPNSQSLRL